MSDPNDTADRDPGDAVPEGVAPKDPVPLSPEDKAVLEKLRHLPETRDQNDRDLACDSVTVRPGSDSPSRAGVTGPGSGADAQSG